MFTSQENGTELRLYTIDDALMCMQDKNDTTLLGRFRRVAYIEDFYDILCRIHTVERCHMGYKKTLYNLLE